MASYILSKAVLVWNSSSCVIGDQPETIVRDAVSIFNHTAGPVYVNDRITLLHPRVFYGNTNLREVSCANCTEIRPSAFESATNLLNAYFPAGASIATMAFADCSKLRSVTLSTTVNRIGIRAFSNCALETMSIATYQTIEAEAFLDCRSLRTFSASTFISHTITTSCFANCTHLSDVTLTGPFTSIASCAFTWAGRDCDSRLNLKINLTDNVSSIFIASSAFLRANLSEVPHASYITQINTQAFGYCYISGSLSLPKCGRLQMGALGYNYFTSVDLAVCSAIQSEAFYSCSSLATITLRSTSLCSLYSIDAFYGTPLKSIYVPASLVDTYKSANRWSYYSSRILPIPDEIGDE